MQSQRKAKRWVEMGLRGAMAPGSQDVPSTPPSLIRRQADALAFFRAILARYAPGESVADPGDAAWLSWLLEGSSAAQRYHGPPPYAFVVHANADLGYAGKGKGFSVVRFHPQHGLLGTTLDPFSITRVLANKDKEEEDLIVRAFRNVVEEDLVQYRADKIREGLVCQMTKVLLHAGDAYVQHEPLFKEWVQKFLTQYGIARTQLAFEESALGMIRLVGGEAWRDYHAHLAAREQNLSVVSFGGYYMSLRKLKEQERRIQDMRLMALRTGR